MLILSNYSAGYFKNNFLFEDLSLSLHEGQIIGIIGTNGCGKSTFLKGIINLVPIKKGSILLDNKEITNWSTDKIFKTNKIGYLSQRNRIFNNLTVEEHIYLQKSCSERKDIKEPINYKKAYSFIKLKKKLFASSLSGGEQLLLNLFCLELIDTEVILLDEPSDTLDIVHKADLVETLISWKNKGKSILLVEQDVELTKKVADKIIKLEVTS
jgi:ABC-type branched-subunit amino acid transport system ATPase component